MGSFCASRAPGSFCWKFGSLSADCHGFRPSHCLAGRMSSVGDAERRWTATATWSRWRIVIAMNRARARSSCRPPILDAGEDGGNRAPAATRRGRSREVARARATPAFGRGSRGAPVTFLIQMRREVEEGGKVVAYCRSSGRFSSECRVALGRGAARSGDHRPRACSTGRAL
jgi:hypothetical protein